MMKENDYTEKIVLLLGFVAWINFSILTFRALQKIDPEIFETIITQIIYGTY